MTQTMPAHRTPELKAVPSASEPVRDPAVSRLGTVHGVLLGTLVRRSVARALLVCAVCAVLATVVQGSPAGAQEGVELSEQLDVRTSAELDRELAESIRQRLQRVGGLAGLTVSVEAGIVRLEGEAANAEIAENAVEIARRTEGVAGVDDAIEVVVDPLARVRETLDVGEQRLLDLIAYLPLLLVAILVFVLFALAARWISRWQAPFRKLSKNVFAQELARQLATIVILVFGGLVALELLDATSLVAALLGTAGVAGIAIGFAFRDLAENYIASVLLSLRQPFSPNDHVVIDDSEGFVIRLTSRATILMTRDGNHLRLPNSKVFKATILNYSRNPTRRFGLAVGVGVDVDLLRAQRLGIEVLEATAGVLSDPGPSARVEALGDSNVLLRFFGWVDQREHDFQETQSNAIRRVKLALDEAGIDMPEPIYRVKLEGDRPGTPSSEAARTPSDEAGRADRRGQREPEPETVGEPASSELAHLAAKIDEDRAAASEQDLLDPTAPVE